MDLSILRVKKDEIISKMVDPETKMIDKRPKLSYSIASLLESVQRSSSPSRSAESLDHQQSGDNDTINNDNIESDAESDLSVDSHGENEDILVKRLDDEEDESEAPDSPSENLRNDAPHPRLTMPTPLMRGALPMIGLPPHLQGLIPPRWPNFSPLNGLNPALLKSGTQRDEIAREILQ